MELYDLSRIVPENEPILIICYYICQNLILVFIFKLFVIMCAVIRQGILGGFSGAVANVIGSSWKGIAVMKSKPLSVANPQTAGQVLQRNGFAGVVVFAQLILSTVIKPLWDRFASQMSGYNDFVATNIGFFVNGVLTVPASLVISKGKMASTAIDSAVYDHSNSSTVVMWTDDSGSGFKLATDEAYVVIYNITKGLVSISAAVDPRNSTSTGITHVGWDLADVKHAYMAFRRVDGTIVSNTSYLIVTSQA